MTFDGNGDGNGRAAVIDRRGLQMLFDGLRKRGYRTIAPSVREGGIVYRDVASVDDLPQGWTDAQAPGSYRLKPREDAALFGYAVGPDSWKRFLFPPRTLLWRGKRTDEGFSAEPEPPDGIAYAFVGVRGCEIAAIRTQDQVFLGAAADPVYETRRSRAFIVAVNCSAPAPTCFCTSMGTGPRARDGFDLSLTEIIDNRRHVFVVETGSDRGRELLDDLSPVPATTEEVRVADAIVDDAARDITREMEAEGIKELLYESRDSPRWNEIAARCLACANCTMVCPTCFCSTVEDATDLTGDIAERWRRWDSCFTLDHSALGPGSVHGSTASRYRQWMTHKLATWVDQFGTSGCVGCGRCITWCPVGIDITEEVHAFRDSASVPTASGREKEG